MADQLKISKTYTFDAAHQLEGHNGKCARLHGHTYQVTVWCKGTQMQWGPANTMVLDYFDLDRIMKPIVEELDHRFMVSGNESALKAMLLGAEQDEDIYDPDWVVYLDVRRTTAEELAKWFASKILFEMPENILVYGVQVCETPKTMAEFIQVMPQGEKQ